MAKSEFTLSGIPDLKKKIKKIQDSLFAKSLMKDIGMFLMLAIKKRTLKGKDFEGNDFIGYENSYAMFRNKAGYQTDFVDLTLTGGMLSSMTYEADNDSVKLFFQNTSDTSGKGKKSSVSNPEKAFYLNEDREFFAISPDDEKQIGELVEKYYKKVLKS